MSTATFRVLQSKNVVAAASGQWGLMVFAGTLLVSASLLFSIQPLFAKMVLPYLGGSPSVWAVAMCFFQAALLAGYCYAHVLNRFVATRWAPLVHLVVCGLAALTLPFGLPSWAHDVPEGNTYLWLIAVLAVGVGLPFFAVSANAPLLQAWFARSGHPHARDPYFLYGASNLGSLVSLLAYPFLIEPMLGLDLQRSVWAGGFYVLTFGLIVCGFLMLVRQGESDKPLSEHGIAVPFADKVEISAIDRLMWIALAFVPSALLVAFTTHITTDVASTPFLWVVPLAAFLGTFVVVFRKHPMIPHDAVLRLHPAIAFAALAFAAMPNLANALLAGGVGFVSFVITTLVCHRTLYQARPEAAGLTEFYLFMSLGGVLGGVFSALVAPQLFNTVAEYPLLIVAGFFARPGIFRTLTAARHRTDFAKATVVAICAVIALALAQSTDLLSSEQGQLLIVILSLSAAMAVVIFSDRPTRVVAGGLVAAILFLGTSLISADGFSERSFFGVSRITTSSDGKFRLLIHGSTIHGGEQLFDAEGKPFDRPPPVLYYYPGSPMANGFDIARHLRADPAKPINVGVIGLGTGSLSCHLKGRETITFYEIDPVVDRIARNANRFHYISRCAPDARTIMGDARLTLAKSKDKIYDYFLVDAFSSDAVPVHLLTREALAIYLSKITDRGLIAFHISNRHLELESVVAATAQSLPGVHVAAILEPDGLPGFAGNPSHVVFLSRNKAAIDKVLTWKHARPADARTTPAWSDNYADILGALWRRYVK